MTDTFSKEKRSQIMRLVKGNKNKSTELKLITFFRANNFKGWRRTYPLFGKPDFVFLSRRVAIFVDGCFWHGHNCRNTKPESNKEYWTKKISRNQDRDAAVVTYLNNKNWNVLRIWECELKEKDILLEIIGNAIK